MTAPAIRIRDLSKRYRLGGVRSVDQTLREVITGLARRVVGRAGGHPSRAAGAGDFWALDGIDLDIESGGVVGIIGRNGAGKSTLLKILSRITDPTRGWAEIRGRVGSLLEVGTGFHPELSGRENIYLNGAILGMRRAEVRRRFDEIVDFSGVERFLDTPVKRYSSGMRVRLAFAVAAHLEPEVLIVDEVLAVGDAAFQRKCLGKMRQVAGGGGRTVLFVSHNMAMVQSLCDRVVVLSDGRVAADADPATGISRYLELTQGSFGNVGVYERSGSGGDASLVRRVRLLDESGSVVANALSGQRLVIEIEYATAAPVREPAFGVRVDGADGLTLFSVQSRFQHGRIETLAGDGVARCTIERLPLAPGDYWLSIGSSSDGEVRDRFERAIHLRVSEADFFGTGLLPNRRQGSVLVPADWELMGATRERVA